LQCQKSCVAGAVTSARPARRARVHTCCFSVGTPVLAATRAFRSPMVSLYCTLVDSVSQVTSVDSTVPRSPGTLPANAPHIYRHGRVRLAGAQREEDLSRATREHRSHVVVSILKESCGLALRRAALARRAWQPPSEAESTPMDAIVGESGASVMVEAQRKLNRYASKQANRHART